MEHLQEQYDAISEYNKLKQMLVLTKQEQENLVYYKNGLYKKCKCCGQIKLKSEYYGRHAYCKACKNNKAKIHYYKKRIILYESKITKCKEQIKVLGGNV